MQVAANQNLRCQSWVNQAVASVFAPPSSAGPDSFASYVDASGRIEAIWFPFTDNPWLKIWSIAAAKPALSVQGHQPVQLRLHQQRHHRGEYVLPGGGDR